MRTTACSRTSAAGSSAAVVSWLPFIAASASARVR